MCSTPYNISSLKSLKFAYTRSNDSLGEMFAAKLLGSQSKCYHYLKQLSRLFQSSSGTTIFEINNGVGGSEAMLFANEMATMYSRFFQHKRWPYSILEMVESDLGGIKSAKYSIQAVPSFENLIQEAGVHRVQRVPKTEKSGRIHTSTITVSVVPQWVLDIKVHARDVEVQTMRSSGAGGQHVNKTESAVRIFHKASGIMVESQESRSQMDNRKTAMRKLLDRIQTEELKKITSKSVSMKQTQVGHADRNEKIRTYNFPQDRITEHRLPKSYFNLKGLMNGDMTIMDKIIEDFKNR